MTETTSTPRRCRRLRHDLRTPLTIVAGFAEVLAADRQISEADRREFATRIQEAAGEIRKLIDDALATRRASRCWRSGVISTTFQASFTRRIPRITHAVGSSSHERSPWNAERGNVWWLWCQDSPIDSSESQKTLVE